jgi:hypothetical protein
MYTKSIRVVLGVVLGVVFGVGFGGGFWSLWCVEFLEVFEDWCVCLFVEIF